MVFLVVEPSTKTWFLQQIAPPLKFCDEIFTHKALKVSDFAWLTKTRLLKALVVSFKRTDLNFKK